MRGENLSPRSPSVTGEEMAAAGGYAPQPALRWAQASKLSWLDSIDGVAASV